MPLGSIHSTSSSDSPSTCNSDSSSQSASPKAIAPGHAWQGLAFIVLVLVLASFALWTADTYNPSRLNRKIGPFWPPSPKCDVTVLMMVKGVPDKTCSIDTLSREQLRAWGKANKDKGVHGNSRSEDIRKAMRQAKVDMQYHDVQNNNGGAVAGNNGALDLQHDIEQAQLELRKAEVGIQMTKLELEKAKLSIEHEKLSIEHEKLRRAKSEEEWNSELSSLKIQFVKENLAKYPHLIATMLRDSKNHSALELCETALEKAGGTLTKEIKSNPKLSAQLFDGAMNACGGLVDQIQDFCDAYNGNEDVPLDISDITDISDNLMSRRRLQLLWDHDSIANYEMQEMCRIYQQMEDAIKDARERR